jgi:hypothetical protein
MGIVLEARLFFCKRNIHWGQAAPAVFTEMCAHVMKLSEWRTSMLNPHNAVRICLLERSRASDRRALAHWLF